MNIPVKEGGFIYEDKNIPEKKNKPFDLLFSNFKFNIQNFRFRITLRNRLNGFL